MAIEYEEYRALMFGCRTGRKTAADFDLWKIRKCQLEQWLRNREQQVRDELNEAFGTRLWDHYRAVAVLELTQSCEYWRAKFNKGEPNEECTAKPPRITTMPDHPIRCE